MRVGCALVSLLFSEFAGLFASIHGRGRTWIHHYTSKSKHQSKQWTLPDKSGEKKTKAVFLPEKVLFSSNKGVNDAVNKYFARFEKSCFSGEMKNMLRNEDELRPKNVFYSLFLRKWKTTLKLFIYIETHNIIWMRFIFNRFINYKALGVRKYAQN